MPRIILSGWAAVYEGDDLITYPYVLRGLDGLIYDDESFTEFLGATEIEDALARALEPGGSLRFEYVEGSPLLRVITEYRSDRDLTPAEIQALADYTEGQWSDGIGENFEVESVKKCGYSLFCLCRRSFGGSDYPSIEIHPG